MHRLASSSLTPIQPADPPLNGSGPEDKGLEFQDPDASYPALDYDPQAVPWPERDVIAARF